MKTIPTAAPLTPSMSPVVGESESWLWPTSLAAEKMSNTEVLNIFEKYR